MARAKGKWRGSGRRCQVCVHPESGRIDFLLVTTAGTPGGGRRALAEKFGVGHNSVYNHYNNHISPEYKAAILAGPFGSENELREMAAQEGVSVLQNLRVLANALRLRFMVGLEAGNDEMIIAYSKPLGDAYWKIGKLTQEVASGQTTVVNNNVL